MKYSLTNEQMLIVWEEGITLHPVYRALKILSAAMADKDEQALAYLSLGQRNQHLMAIYEHYFGKTMACFTSCSHCKEPLEFVLNTDMFAQLTVENRLEHTITIDDYSLTFRGLNSLDLVAAAKQLTSEQAQIVLLERSIIRLLYQNNPCSVDVLPLLMIDELAEQLIKADVNAEIVLHINCPACANKLPFVLDIADYLWDEISIKVKQLLNQVHEMACVYGWSAKDILAMSEVQRQFYMSKLLQ
jgi:hypothetical protein